MGAILNGQKIHGAYLDGKPVFGNSDWTLSTLPSGISNIDGGSTIPKNSIGYQIVAGMIIFSGGLSFDTTFSSGQQFTFWTAPDDINLSSIEGAKHGELGNFVWLDSGHGGAMSIKSIPYILDVSQKNLVVTMNDSTETNGREFDDVSTLDLASFRIKITEKA